MSFPSTKTTRSAFASLLLAAAAAAAAPLAAQSEAILGTGNAAFARALADAGLDDQAEGVSRVIQTRPDLMSEDEGLEIEALALSLRELRARREPDPLARKDLLVQIIADKNAFIDGHSRTRSAEYLRGDLPNSYLMLGETLSDAIQAEKDPSKVAELRFDGLSRFAKAEEALKDRIELLEQRHQEGSISASYYDRQSMSASYGLARTLYFHALLFPEGDPEQQRVLEEAIGAFSDFALDYGAYLQSYEGLIYQGLCDKRRGDTQMALEDFDSAIALREGYLRDDNGVYDAPSEVVDVLSWAVQEKMRLLAELGEHTRVVETAEDYLASLPEAESALRGMAVLLAKARAESALDELDAARASAERLIELDPQGDYGAAARSLMTEFGSGGLDAAALLKVAETMSAQGRHDRALDLCRQVRERAANKPELVDVGVDAYLLSGSIYVRQDRLHEASLAFDSAAEVAKDPKQGGDALWKAVNAYQRLHSQERRPFYEKRAQDRMRQLANRYPSHPRAAYAQLLEGQLLEGQGEWQKALDLYLQMKAGAQGYEEGQYRAGSSLYRLSREEAQAGKEAEAKAHLARAEQQLRTSMEMLDKAEKNTLDRELQAEFQSLEYLARALLCRLLIDDGRSAEVDTLLADAEERYGAESDRIANVWSLRIQAKQGQGKLDEAIQLFESLLQKDPNAPGIAASAGVLARALDLAGVEEFEKTQGSPQGVDLWRKAAYYYGISIKPQLDGSASLLPDSVGEVAQRLYTMALVFNGVPETADTFVDWQEKPKEPALWEEAARIYEKLLSLAPSQRTMIQLARTFGLLGRMDEAAGIYARVFDTLQLVEPGPGGKFDPRVIRANPESIYAYLEWGVAEHLTGMAEQDRDRQSRAYEIFKRLNENTEPDSRLWWQATYYQVKSWFDRGDYPNAKIAMRNVKRTANENFDEGKYGLQPRFVALENELKKK